MRIAVMTPEASARGGLALATLRLATALHESDHDVTVLYGRGSPGGAWPFAVRHVAALVPPVTQAAALAADLAGLCPELVIDATTRLAGVRAATEAAPTLVRTPEHSLLCPVGSKYWTHPGRACTVRAGAKCALLRPVLGCGSRRGSLDPEPIVRQRRLEQLVVAARAGMLAPSDDQRDRLVHQGYPPSLVGVVPNLGVRSSPRDLREELLALPPDLRDSLAYLGRTTKEKGADLLPVLAQHPRLRVFGRGYLDARLAPAIGWAVRAPLSQHQVAAVLLWSRAVLFPSRWPEPGGIVGIDAQLAGAPVLGIREGAAKEWPYARLCEPASARTDLRRWADATRERGVARDPDAFVAAQERYSDLVRGHLDHVVRHFVSSGRVPYSPGAVTDTLRAARPEGTSW